MGSLEELKEMQFKHSKKACFGNDSEQFKADKGRSKGPKLLPRSKILLETMGEGKLWMYSRELLTHGMTTHP